MSLSDAMFVLRVVACMVGLGLLLRSLVRGLL